MLPKKDSSHNIFIIGDSAVNPEPSSDDLVQIAESLQETHRAFCPGIEPRLAFLSFSTYASGV